MKMVFKKTSVLVLFLTLIFCGNASAAEFDEAVSQAMQRLAVSKGDPGLLVLTDAPYVQLGDASALNYLDQAQELTGCTVGKGNLLFFQRPQSHCLRLMLYSKADGDAVIISRENSSWSVEILNLSAAAISTADFWEKAKNHPVGKDLFTLATLANVWARGGPYDFLKSAELHNHICPGVTSGYLMAHYILDHYPLGQGERYTVVACPVWCKEDALQVVLDCTPGKRGMIVKPLSKAQLEKISVANPAGMVLIWNEKNKTGKGAALSFDFDRLRALSPGELPKAAMVLSALDHLDQPDRFVATAAEFELDEERYQQIVQAGSNPYQVVGLMKK
jgi:formylmethanofuran dehydrogenase subunit E-like metal-binding protein